MPRVRVLIADDSRLARALLRDFLEAEPDMEVVGEACNGREAVELTRALKPSIVTMDLEMPLMGGLEAIETIMCSKAVPILVVSARADARNALAALGCGALEVLGKPDCTPAAAAEFVAKVRLLAGVTVITRLRRAPKADTTGLTPPVAPAAADLASTPLPGPCSYPRVFAIASSTGGPQALVRILTALPSGFSCPVLIAQHISDGFAQGMVDWLGGLCRLPVRLAAEGELLQAGVIYISPSERHFSVTPSGHIALLARSASDVFHPSCDVLLHAVAKVFGRQAIGIILTGMSSDGAKGIARIRELGGVTLAQDEATSVVFGMNRVAIEAGAVQQILPLQAIAAAMAGLAVALPLSTKQVGVAGGT